MIRRMASTVANTRRNLIAICQMTNDNDLEANWVVAKEMIERASERNAKVIFFEIIMLLPFLQMIFFPEAVDYVGRTREEEVFDYC